MKYRVYSTSMLGGATESDEKSQITSLLSRIGTNVHTVASHREQISGVNQFLAESPLQAQTQHVEPPAIENARGQAQQLVTALTVASHMPKDVLGDLKPKADALLQHIDAWQSGWGESVNPTAHLIAIQALLEQLTSATNAWSPSSFQFQTSAKTSRIFANLRQNSAGEDVSVPPQFDLAKLGPAGVCRNLPPKIQKWFEDSESDCTTLPPEVLVGVAKCAVTDQLFDAATGICAPLEGPGSGGGGPVLPGSKDTPVETLQEETSVWPWAVGAAAVAAVGVWWFKRKKDK